jgi:hypothetical protein
MRGIVEDVLWEGGVLTTDEIYRGVKTKHAQLGQLLPPRWQEEVKRILEAHCISHEGNSWFLENIEQLIKANPRGPLHFARGQFVVSRKHRTIDKGKS